MNKKRIAIIGGGPGGLMTAYRLQQKSTLPCEVTLYEATGRLGGKVVTNRFQTAPIGYEAGAAELYDYSRLGPDPLRELVDELGLKVREMYGGTVVLDGHILRNLDDVGRMFGEAPRRELKRLISRARSLISPAEYYESDWREDNKDPLARQTFRDFLAAIKDPIARRYVEVAVHSDLATEPHKTNAMYGLQNYLMDESDYMRLYSIDGGNERLTQQLADRIAAEVRLESPVMRVERLPNGNYVVESRHRGERSIAEYRSVVVALPNSWIPTIDWRGDSLAKAMDAHHAYYDYPAHYLRVSILFKKPFWRDRISGSFFMHDAFGGCCIYDETARLDGCEYGVLGWLLGGEPAALLSNQDDASLIGRMLDSLPNCLAGARDQFLEGHVTRWVNSVCGLPAGSPMREPESRHYPDMAGHPELYVVGDYLFDSTLNGVLDSADTVVDELIEGLAGVAAPTPVVVMAPLAPEPA
jgi:monoamine oxidase